MAPTQPHNERIVLAHGGGGQLTRQLLGDHVLGKLQNEWLDPLGDSAILPAVDGKICFTTDSFVVEPLEFPGGDIGRLAVCGTVNDLAVAGAVPVALSLAMVLTEGLKTDLLDRIMDSIAAAASEASVPVATGDTKVIQRAGAEKPGILLTTAGLGRLREGVNLSTQRIESGDVILLNGNLAEHGLAVMIAREELGLKNQLVSDVAPLADLVAAMLDAGDVKFLRDPTRGGLAGLLADITEDTHRGVQIEENAIPLSPETRHAAELLGLDPLIVANEGKVVAVVAESDAPAVLDACRNHPLGRNAARIGRVGDPQDAPLVELVTRIGGRRIVQRPYGELLPRIC